MTIYVLLFNAGTDSEGIHTLKTNDDRNIVLMFENRDDAERYTLMLEAQDFLVPTVEAFEQEDIEEFCNGAGYEYKLVAQGDLELPPEASVDQTDWEKQQEPASNGDGSNDMSDSELDRIRRQLEGLL